MIGHLVDLVSILILAYSLVLQSLLTVLAAVSAWSLHRQSITDRFGRVEDMLTSATSPPVSIVVPAHNEAAGIVASVRSMAMLSYPRFEIVVVNDGSSDRTLDELREGFKLERLAVPFRAEIATAPIRGVYRSTLPTGVVVVDKENGGRADALNAGINLARYPYVVLADADVILDSQCLLRVMRLVVEDRVRTVAVGGNVRPLNGCEVRYGHVVDARLPGRMIERMQLLEYLRSFIGSRPAWSLFGALPLISGAFGVYRRDALTAVGGLTRGHLGEDLDLTMRLHRHFRRAGEPYRIVYAPQAVAWTEVPATLRVLRRQRLRWHRGLTRAVVDFRDVLFNPRMGVVGLLSWPSMVLFEFVAPIVEALGWIVLPLALGLGLLNTAVAGPLAMLSFLAGMINSLLALFLDERFGYFERPMEAFRLLTIAFIENLGLRQLTVWWRIRSLLGPAEGHRWGNMERRGLSNLGAA
jgi:cellulose synthase/poly-beta-1,6-N-acetylglucosamine synthase-like glycosyltransferase